MASPSASIRRVCTVQSRYPAAGRGTSKSYTAPGLRAAPTSRRSTGATVTATGAADQRRRRRQPGSRRPPGLCFASSSPTSRTALARICAGPIGKWSTSPSGLGTPTPSVIPSRSRTRHLRGSSVRQQAVKARVDLDPHLMPQLACSCEVLPGGIHRVRVDRIGHASHGRDEGQREHRPESRVHVSPQQRPDEVMGADLDRRDVIRTPGVIAPKLLDRVDHGMGVGARRVLLEVALEHEPLVAQRRASGCPDPVGPRCDRESAAPPRCS